jgi:hypothetical protein
MRRERGRMGEVKKGERDREYDKWVPREQNRRGRETTRVREMRGLEYPVLDIRRGNRTRPILVGVKGLNPVFIYLVLSPMEATPATRPSLDPRVVLCLGFIRPVK